MERDFHIRYSQSLLRPEQVDATIKRWEEITGHKVVYARDEKDGHIFRITEAGSPSRDEGAGVDKLSGEVG